MTLLMYVKPGCPWCEQQRERFRSQGVEWEEIDAKADPAARQELIRYTGLHRHGATSPCIATPTGSVRLTSDSSVVAQGFTVDSVVAC